ncbi:CIC11C00000004808 [Sungouiella intermedia]|uniref:CIC11C00000004808 n=1 Tax=Sungouiella intermedia TaxID=45354 RepID=A0A1L0GAS3_9ASCO|nr:CIC11C00000004808 [[Candida] intermedia]
MFAVIQEDHESCHKRKPRLLQSQGVGTGPSTDSLRLTVDKKTLNVSFSPVSMLDYRRVAKTLALAFDKDPFVNYILNTATEYDPSQSRLIKKKHDLMLSLFEYSVYEYMSVGGLVVVVKDNNLELEMIQQRMRALAINKIPFLGVACWSKLVYDDEDEVYQSALSMSSLSNMHPSSLKYNLFSSLAKCRLRVQRIGDTRLKFERDGVLEAMISSHQLNKENNVWYLGDVGIIPAAQGHGLAKKLINHCLENYMKGHWCYLESSNLANRKFYEKLGWVLKKTFIINDEVTPSESSDSDDSSSSTRRNSFSRKPLSKPVSAEELLYIDSFMIYADVN